MTPRQVNRRVSLTRQRELLILCARIGFNP